MNFKDILENNPIVAAVKDEKQLDKVLKTDVQVIFVLFGDILNVKRISEKIENAQKIGIVHVDLVEGLSNKEVALEFLKITTKFKGIISTKPQIVRAAKRLGFIAVQRIFIIDSLSLASVEKHLVEECDALEMLPGLLSKVIENLSKSISMPLIAGGLISDKDDVMQALKCGATCISTTRENIWSM
ncbi:glycerol-3-phosphate responsive antiterminator [Clostridium fallax]|uniref:Glycerol uptake operon antiterminator n=1 Tax=Clostridium fallax TaxID=1533 RepID=A0A1M4Y1N4_9CLOT|nr:glycerol-3-phosphate responsive antiterminator [Clostridium fallax]SHE99483.1 glycerol uptake operon antiterminator [Clostridium fallax]SQB07768.1 glycerol uptake operon antiterminator [Clostridium fallax]